MTAASCGSTASFQHMVKQSINSTDLVVRRQPLTKSMTSLQNIKANHSAANACCYLSRSPPTPSHPNTRSKIRRMSGYLQKPLSVSSSQQRPHKKKNSTTGGKSSSSLSATEVRKMPSTTGGPKGIGPWSPSSGQVNNHKMTSQIMNLLRK